MIGCVMQSLLDDDSYTMKTYTVMQGIHCLALGWHIFASTLGPKILLCMVVFLNLEYCDSISKYGELISCILKFYHLLTITKITFQFEFGERICSTSPKPPNYVNVKFVGFLEHQDLWINSGHICNSLCFRKNFWSNFSLNQQCSWF